MHEFPAQSQSGPCLYTHETQSLACGCMSFELHRMAKRDDDPRDMYPDAGRWGRLLVVGLAPTYDMTMPQLWWAREDLKGGNPVIFARAHIVEDDVNHGRLAFKECTECWHTGLCQADDYACIECRGVDMELLYESGRFGRRLQA